jgi:hypothetical protein
LVEDQEASLPNTSWIPRPSVEREVLGYLTNPNWSGDFNWRQVDMVLETVQLEKIEAALAATPAKAPSYPIDLYLAYRRVATRANYLFPGYFEAGFLDATRRDLTGRPYVLASKDAEGGVAGIASVSIESGSDRSLFKIHLNQRAYFQSTALIETRKDKSEWKFFPYTQDNGRRLISSIKLKRNDEPIAVKEMGPDGSGSIIFEAPPITDWSGVVLQVDLSMFSDTRQLIFELFATRIPGR